MKKYFAVLVACVVLMCLNVEAQGEPKVTIYGAASGIPNSVVAEIVAENPDAQEITFLKWENAVLDNELVMPLAGWTYSDIVVKTESTNVTLADKFIISVAKGAKTTLSKEFSATVSASVKFIEFWRTEHRQTFGGSARGGGKRDGKMFRYTAIQWTAGKFNC